MSGVTDLLGCDGGATYELIVTLSLLDSLCVRAAALPTPAPSSFGIMAQGVSVVALFACMPQLTPPVPS